MSEETKAHPFSEHHQRHVRTTFQYIDKLLSEAEHTMIDAGSASPFRRHSDDTTPIQRKVTHDYILRIREAMRRVMEELNILPPEPHSGAVWAAAINLMYCSISLNELTPERMRAYGPLSPEAADRLDGIRAELDGLVAKLRNYLGKGAGGDLQQRLQQLGKTGDEIRLLSEIERIITAHGLVEFRGTLSMLLDRMESAAFEVGVFGRVSSGKSSLLNYILQTDILPVGVTPVTAIPTRISHGPLAEAGIEFAEAQPQIIPLSELPEFATEQKNPANKKHVTRIFVKLPSDRLAEGVTFVDTPGLGSLAVAGAEETIAYLPRCDLGIVLIDASTGLTQDDLVVVQALYQSGASAMILISKTDLFSAADRQQMIEYVKANLRSQLGVEPPIHAVSVFGADARCAITGLKANSAHFSRNITNSPSLRKGARLGACAKRSSARWSGDCKPNQERLSRPARFYPTKRPKRYATATGFWNVRKANLFFSNEKSQICGGQSLISRHSESQQQ
jgi:GTP-binding protein EngB required for normal cell division